jgi:YesN/AraC family two-component response regulator
MSEKARILIVDDEKHIRESITELLIDSGYGVGSAASGEEALTKLKAESFDIALVDIKMPKMSGIEFLEKIKTDQPRVDIIMITGYATINMAVECLKLGAYDFLVKPCDNNEMLTSINRLLEKRRLSYELTRVNVMTDRIVDAIDESIMLIDTDFNIIKVNKQLLKKVNRREEDVIGKRCYEITHNLEKPCQPPHDTCPVVDIAKLNTGHRLVHIHKHFTSNGREIYVEVSAYPVFNPTSAVLVTKKDEM